MAVQGSSILSTKQVSPSDARFFPSITSYLDRDSKERIHFKYVGFLEDSPDCMTLRAQTLIEPIRDIAVKFADRYGAKAHDLLASKSLKLAPELLYCGSPHIEDSDPSYDSLTMIVMEFIDGKTLAKSKMDRKTAEMVKLKIKEALNQLHENGLVFGDLRSPNVMITPAMGVRLIDFNWAGEKGQAKYPCLISPEIPWPTGVEALAEIEADHDLQMLEKIFSRSAPFITDS
jgi:serine/threonine protein kinase